MEKNKYLVKTLSFSLAISLVSFFLWVPSVIALSDAEKKEIGTEITTMYRAARAVIGKNQKHINDASVGDKGLSAEVVITKTKENYKKATGNDFAMASGGVKAATQKALLDAISEVMNNAQGH